MNLPQSGLPIACPHPDATAMRRVCLYGDGLEMNRYLIRSFAAMTLHDAADS